MICYLHRGQITLRDASNQIGPASDPQIGAADFNDRFVMGEQAHQQFRTQFTGCEKDQGDMINLTTYIIKELDMFKEAELTGIRAFYQKQLDDARENSEGWSDLVQSIA